MAVDPLEIYQPPPETAEEGSSQRSRRSNNLRHRSSLSLRSVISNTSRRSKRTSAKTKLYLSAALKAEEDGTTAHSDPKTYRTTSGDETKRAMSGDLDPLEAAGAPRLSCSGLSHQRHDVDAASFESSSDAPPASSPIPIPAPIIRTLTPPPVLHLEVGQLSLISPTAFGGMVREDMPVSTGQEEPENAPADPVDPAITQSALSKPLYIPRRTSDDHWRLRQSSKLKSPSLSCAALHDALVLGSPMPGSNLTLGSPHDTDFCPAFNANGSIEQSSMASRPHGQMTKYDGAVDLADAEYLLNHQVPHAPQPCADNSTSQLNVMPHVAAAVVDQSLDGPDCTVSGLRTAQQQINATCKHSAEHGLMDAADSPQTSERNNSMLSQADRYLESLQKITSNGMTREAPGPCAGGSAKSVSQEQAEHSDAECKSGPSVLPGFKDSILEDDSHPMGSAKLFHEVRLARENRYKALVGPYVHDESVDNGDKARGPDTLLSDDENDDDHMPHVLRASKLDPPCAVCGGPNDHLCRAAVAAPSPKRPNVDYAISSGSSDQG